FGDGVNIASRLQEQAAPDTICISDIVYRDVAKKVTLGTVVSLGRPKLKNIAERFHVYALLPEAPNGFRQKLQVQRLKLSRRVRPAHQVAVAGLVLVAATIVAVRYFSRPPLSIQDSVLSTPAALAEAVEVLRINPNFSLEIHKERVPIKDPATLERHLA